MSITQYLFKTYPNNRFSISGTEYESLDWPEDNPDPKPTVEEFNANLNYIPEPLTQEQIDTQLVSAQRLAYIGQRTAEYPSIQNQLDALYHDIKSGNLESGTWITSIESVKTKYPKP
jgi:hypothetical protein